MPSKISPPTNETSVVSVRETWLNYSFKLLNINPFSAGTAFMLMQTGWTQACLPLSLSLPIKKQAEFTGFEKQTTI